MSRRGDGTLSWLRDRNRERVVGVLRERGRVSQAEIARATGLSRTTVHSLVADLKEGGLVYEAETDSSRLPGGGRPGVQLALKDSSKVALGIDFGHSHVQVAVAGMAHDILA